jgi:hypothetical protein
MAEYVPRFGAHISKTQAIRYGNRLEEIAVEGEITPELVLEDAKDSASPLHDYFEWDDSTAAFEWRLQQARVLIRSIDLVREDRPQETTNAYHFVKTTYVASAKVFSDEEKSRHVIDNALSELKGWQIRYKQYKELAKLNDTISQGIREMEKVTA